MRTPDQADRSAATWRSPYPTRTARGQREGATAAFWNRPIRSSASRHSASAIKRAEAMHTHLRTARTVTSRLTSPKVTVSFLIRRVLHRACPASSGRRVRNSACFLKNSHTSLSWSKNRAFSSSFCRSPLKTPFAARTLKKRVPLRWLNGVRCLLLKW